MDLQKITIRKHKLALVMILSLLINPVLVGMIMPANSYAANPINVTEGEDGDIYTVANTEYNELQKKYNDLQRKYEKLQNEHEALLNQVSIEEVKQKPVINLSTNTITVQTIHAKRSQPEKENITESANTQTAEKVETEPEETPAEIEATTEATTEEPVTETPAIDENGHLTAYAGVFYGPSGKETYYNLPMDGVISMMRNKGYSEEEYPYWIREDGCKMFGDYIMVAADLNTRPKGTILECSLGTAMVVDTGDFAKSNNTQLDIATNW